MSSKVRPLGRKSGFTLVELLIVVAIIGILATVGIPTWQRLMQKSKKSEAQVNLGGLYTAEQAFISEYGGFGNNLAALGALEDGQNQLYVVGFPTAACASRVAKNSNAIMPTKAGGIGTAINTAFPTYYSGANAFPTSLMVTSQSAAVAGSAAAPVIVGQASSLVKCNFAATTPMPNNLAAAKKNTYDVFDVNAGDAGAFIAGAIGVIAPGQDLTGNGNPSPADIWAINNDRVLSNTQDGVH